MISEKKTVRHLPPASSFAEKLIRMRFTLARRVAQLLVLALFIGTARWDWAIGGHPILSGDLSASTVLDLIPLADPLALLERLAAGILPTATVLLDAAIVLTAYGVLGARVFCGWICPMNLVVEAAQWLRTKCGFSADFVRISKKSRYVVLAGVLIASAATGSAAFEAVSPQGFLWRDLIWGSGLSALACALAIFALELFVMRDGWCGHLCPLGAFWACVGHAQPRPQLSIRFEAKQCTHCGDCLHVCPERQIIRFKTLEKLNRIPTAECIACGRCISICPENALHFALEPFKSSAQSQQPNQDLKNNASHSAHRR